MGRPWHRTRALLNRRIGIRSARSMLLSRAVIQHIRFPPLQCLRRAAAPGAHYWEAVQTNPAMIVLGIARRLERWVPDGGRPVTLSKTSAAQNRRTRGRKSKAGPAVAGCP